MRHRTFALVNVNLIASQCEPMLFQVWRNIADKKPMWTFMDEIFSPVQCTQCVTFHSPLFLKSCCGSAAIGLCVLNYKH